MNSRSACSHRRRLLRHWKSLAYLLSRICVCCCRNARQFWCCSAKHPRMLPHTFFLWHFLSKAFHMCFSPSTHTLCVHHQISIVSPLPRTHALTRSHTPRTFEPCRHLSPARYRLWRKIRLTSSKKAVKFMSRTLCFRRPFLRQGLLIPVCCPFPNKTIWSLSVLVRHLPTPSHLSLLTGFPIRSS